jgi:thiamine biosynthesis lipoprotein
VKVTPEVFQLLSRCLEVSRESEGAFDISVGPLMKVWGFYKGTGHLPRQEEVARALAKTGYRKIQLDSENRTVRFTEAGVELDPGGIGKGYAVDRMIETLKENGIASALITAGGSSIYALGAPNNEKGWEIKIRDPKNQRKTLTEVYLKDESMSTSGSYEKFFEADGKIYSHIMDPRTGYPASGQLAVSVIAPKTLDSEAWTKPYFILGRQWTANHKPKNFRVYICEDRAEQPCAWLQ